METIKRLLFILCLVPCMVQGQTMGASQLKKDGVTIKGNASNQLQVDTTVISTHWWSPTLAQVINAGNMLDPNQQIRSSDGLTYISDIPGGSSMIYYWTDGTNEFDVYPDGSGAYLESSVAGGHNGRLSSNYYQATISHSDSIVLSSPRIDIRTKPPFISYSDTTKYTILARDKTNGQLKYTSIPTPVNKGSVGVTYDGQNGVISTNNYTSVTMPYACTITNWYISSINGSSGSALSGSIVIDIKRSGTSIIGAGNKPTLASASSGNAGATAWTSVDVSQYDQLDFYVVSATSCTKVNVTLIITKN